jgi:hypothetical protein
MALVDLNQQWVASGAQQVLDACDLALNLNELRFSECHAFRVLHSAGALKDYAPRFLHTPQRSEHPFKRRVAVKHRSCRRRSTALLASSAAREASGPPETTVRPTWSAVIPAAVSRAVRVHVRTPQASPRQRLFVRSRDPLVRHQVAHAMPPAPDASSRARAQGMPRDRSLLWEVGGAQASRS